MRFSFLDGSLMQLSGAKYGWGHLVGTVVASSFKYVFAPVGRWGRPGRGQWELLRSPLTDA